MTFHQRKAHRTQWYFKFVYGWKQRKCSACNGSGYYDHNGSPECGACDGTLIFKWNELHVPTRELLKLAEMKPAFGHPSGIRANTHWVTFFKD